MGCGSIFPNMVSVTLYREGYYHRQREIHDWLTCQLGDPLEHRAMNTGHVIGDNPPRWHYHIIFGDIVIEFNDPEDALFFRLVWT